MTDITQVPETELLFDLKESIEDVAVCQHALSIGVTEYSGGGVQSRLDVNKVIIDKIKKELARRWSSENIMRIIDENPPKYNLVAKPIVLMDADLDLYKPPAGGFRGQLPDREHKSE